jgi:hypothetical protein
MSRLSILTFGLLLLASAVDVRAQSDKPDCPTISVTGPAGILQPGDLATFTVQIDNPQKFGHLEYEWTVEGGELVEGQGTDKIQVRFSDVHAKLTASLRIRGLPEGCANTASEIYQLACILPVPVLLDEFGRLANDAIRTRLTKLFAVLEENPNNQGYVILYGTESEMKSSERSIFDGIGFRRFDRSRITIVKGGRHESGKFYTKLYRVRLVPIIQLPKSMSKLVILCSLAMAFVPAVIGQTETPANCPKISVTGPPGITQPGDSMEFKAIMPLNSTDRLTFQWTISAGTIESGQGTAVIKLRTTREMNNSSVTATVEISGLPKDCPGV